MLKHIRTFYYMLFENVRFNPVFVHTIDGKTPSSFGRIIEDLDRDKYTIVKLYSPTEGEKEFRKFEEQFIKQYPNLDETLLIVIFGYSYIKPLTD